MAVYTVDTLTDIIDGNDGKLSLREALARADATEEADTIHFASAVQGGTLVLAGSQLTVASDVTIDGGSGVTIDADGRSRVLLVRSGTEDDSNEITLAHVTVTGGKPTGDNRPGGGIYASWNTSITLTDSAVTGNSTTGDFLRGGGIGSHGAVSLTDSTVSGNSTLGQWAAGGGIWSSYSVTLTNSTVNANSVAGDASGGGGIAAGYVRLVDSSVSDNSGGGIDAGAVFLVDTVVERNEGGGISASDVVAENSRIADNQSDAAGGGIRASRITLTDSEVVGNTTTGDYAGGGGIFVSDAAGGGITLTLIRSVVGENSTDGDNSYGGGIACGTYTYSTIRLYDSVVRNNKTSGQHAYGGGIASTFYSDVIAANSAIYGNATSGDYAHGGGIKGSVTLTNSTVSGNLTTGEHAGGGGIAGSAVLTNTTVAGNRTTGGSADGGGIGGGYAGGGYARVVNSIVAGNSTAHGSSPDVHGSIYSNGSNIFGSEVDGSTPSDRESVAPELLFAQLDPETGGGQLAENGGPSPTIALRDADNNPALGRADPDATPDTDQRGATRPQPSGTIPDVGAFELDQSDPAPLPTARTYLVTSTSDVTADDGQLTLREALALADADNLTADRIEFASAIQGQTITLSGTQLTINSDVTIDGGAGVTIDANQASRVILVQGVGTDAVLDHLTITGGFAEINYDYTSKRTDYGGGGIFVARYAAVSIDYTTITENRTSGEQSRGGGIAGWSISLDHSTVDSNSARKGGGISGAEITLYNSTIANNTAYRAAGLYGDDVKVAGSTVSANVAEDYTGGIRTRYGGRLSVADSIVSGNYGRFGSPDDIGSRITFSNGHNIFGGDVEGDVQGDVENAPAVQLFAATNPLLGGGLLGDNGGPTLTIALRNAPDNPALGGADSAGGSATDQRGEARPLPSDGNPDIGAFELEQSDFTGPSAGTTYLVTSTSDVTADDGQLTLREALALADVDPLTPDRIEFAADVQGQSIALAGSQLTVGSDVTIDGGAGLTIDAGGQSRVLQVQGFGTDVVLQHLTITGGHTTADGEAGGGVQADRYTTLTLDHTAVTSNSTAGYRSMGGGISGALVTLTNSRVSGNSTMGEHAAGGGIWSFDSLTLTDSTVSGNSTTGDSAVGGGIAANVYAIVTLTNSTVSDNTTAGYSAGGGGISGDSVSLTNSTISRNSALGANAGGGGISGDVTLISSTVSDNKAVGFGGGIGGGDVKLINSTVSGNTSIGQYGSGGGISGIDVTVTGSTISGNSASGANGHGGGVAAYGVLSVANSIIAGNRSDYHELDVAGTIAASNGHNIFGSDVAGIFQDDLENVTSSLLFAAIDPTTGGGLLADNGGPTPTIALRDDPTNPALGGADAAGAPETDQRGVARPSPAGTDPDIGAFECEWMSLVPARPFDGLAYVASYDDLIRALGPDEAAGEVHYRTYGVFEGRGVSFDGLEYIASYDDLIQRFGVDRDAGATHFIRQGFSEGRTTSFDGLEYVASYDDLIAALGADRDIGSTHFIDNGATEGRQVTFDGLQYIASYEDLIQALGPNGDAGAVHFIRNGAAEARVRDDFDEVQYLKNYLDLQAAFGDDAEAATVHYIRYGHAEGRTDEPVQAVADFLV